MHVSQLLDALALAPHIEITKPPLPNLTRRIFPQAVLAPELFQNLSGETLLHNLHDQ